ncbi:hypothetical protein B4U80_06611, partial [Leptotrombidium deliense]
RCKSFGGYVVSINSEDENKFVKSKIKKTSFWIGAQKVKNDTYQPWSWADGSEITYFNWDIDFHDMNIRNTAFSCAMMFASNGKWFDAKCTRQGAQTCELVFKNENVDVHLLIL